MSATELLDQLDALHAAATVGPWRTDEAHGRDISDEAYSWHAVVQPNDDEVATTWPVGHERHDPAADAALIVGAVNALPQLTAALRGVLDLADDWDRNAAIFPEYGDLSAAAAQSIRATITATLSPAQPQSGNPA